MLINEETIRNIVAESLKNILSEKTLLKLGNSNPRQSNTPVQDMGIPPMNNSDMGGDPNASPMDDPNMDGDPNAVPMDDPNMGGDPNAAPMDDPNMDGDMESAPMDSPNMDDDGNDMGGEEDDDSTVAIINQLSDTDKEAVRSYAKSMLHRDEAQNGGGEGELPPSNEQPISESFVFTKKQIQMLRENFGPTDDELSKKDDRKPLGVKKSNKVPSNSPFNSPKFN